MKYSLWFKDVSIEWLYYSPQPNELYAQVGIWVSNGGRESPIVVEAKQLDVEISGVTSATSKQLRPLRLLPDQTKRFLSDRIDHIPHGDTSGTVTYKLRYGPVGGFPVYERTHKVRFQMRNPVTPKIARSGGASAWTWTELEPEIDIDVYPPTSR